MTDESFDSVISRYLWDDSCGYSRYGVEELDKWLASDIVRLIELLDAELQMRSDSLPSIDEDYYYDVDEEDCPYGC